MGNDNKPGRNLSLSTIPDFEEPEINNGDTRVERSTVKPEVTAVMGYGPTIPSFNVPGLPDDVRIEDDGGSNVDDMIADSLHAAVLPQPATLGSILRTSAYVPTDTSPAPLGSLADHIPSSPGDQSAEKAVAVARSPTPVVLLTLLAVAAAIALAVVFWLGRHR